MKERNKLVPPLSFDSTCLFPSVLSRSFRLKYLPAAICSLSLFFFLWKRRSCSTLEMASPKSLCQHNTLLPYIPLAGPAHELPARIFVNYIIVHIYNDEKQSKRKTVCSDRELSLEYKHSTKQKIERWGTHTHVRIVIIKKRRCNQAGNSRNLPDLQSHLMKSLRTHLLVLAYRGGWSWRANF